VAGALALFTVFFLAWLTLQPPAAPLPTGPFLPGFSAPRAQAHVQAPRPADGAASALLETMRVLRARPPLDNDHLFVFTDADAGQPMGARVFMASHPWAKRVRVALRFDNAGNHGPLELIGAAHADGLAVDAWTRDAPSPHGDSFRAELDARLPQRLSSASLQHEGDTMLALLHRFGNASLPAPAAPRGQSISRCRSWA
jgi:hypothetical protein